MRSVSDVRVLEVIHGDERTMEAVGLAVMWSLADPSRVVVDLSTLVVATEPVWPSSLNDLGPLTRHWPATPVALTSPSPQVRDALHQLPQADHLVVTASVSEAVTI